MRISWKKDLASVVLILADGGTVGMRNEEAVALAWENINFDKNIIFNTRVKAEDTDGWVPLGERLKEVEV